MYKRILVPIDGSPTSVQGVDEAIRLAKLTGAKIHLVHVLDQLPFVTGFEVYSVDIIGILKSAGTEIAKRMQDRVAASGVDVSSFVSDVLPGRVCDVVMEQAEAMRSDLIVLGTHGRRGMSRLLIGSDAEQIVRTSSIPVLLVRGTAAAEAPDAPHPPAIAAESPAIA